MKLSSCSIARRGPGNRGICPSKQCEMFNASRLPMSVKIRFKAFLSTIEDRRLSTLSSGIDINKDIAKSRSKENITFSIEKFLQLAPITWIMLEALEMNGTVRDSSPFHHWIAERNPSTVISLQGGKARCLTMGNLQNINYQHCFLIELNLMLFRTFTFKGIYI